MNDFGVFIYINIWLIIETKFRYVDMVFGSKQCNCKGNPLLSNVSEQNIRLS